MQYQGKYMRPQPKFSRTHPQLQISSMRPQPKVSRMHLQLQASNMRPQPKVSRMHLQRQISHTHLIQIMEINEECSIIFSQNYELAKSIINELSELRTSLQIRANLREI